MWTSPYRSTGSDATDSPSGSIPSRGLLIDPYGPALQGRQTGPLSGIILGGRNAELLDAARGLFEDRLAGYHLADERVRLGFHPDNPVNLPSARGVQIELPAGPPRHR